MACLKLVKAGGCNMDCFKLSVTLSGLPFKKRMALYLLKEEERTYKEVAAELEVPVSALEKQVAGTLKILRKKLMMFFSW
jgi:DNA-directed RNA polymerase specialized sigma24 family protein